MTSEPTTPMAAPSPPGLVRPGSVGIAAWWPDLTTGGAVTLVGLVEVLTRAPFLWWAPTILMLVLGIAVASARHLPWLAFGLMWVAAVIQLLTGTGPWLVEAAVGIVAYGMARHGSTSLVWLSGLSIPAVGMLGLLWTGAPNDLIDVATGLRYGSPDLVALTMPLLAWGLILFLVLGLPWFVGLTMRSLDRSRASQTAAERRQAEAEARSAAAEHARLQAQEIATLKEGHAQLARDVHDVVGHSLAVILAQAEAARTRPDSDVEAMREAMGNVADSARRSLGDVRAVLSRTGGEAAATTARGGLTELVNGVAAAGNDVRLSVLGEPVPLPPELEQVSYRVLQEMLTNALKHGRQTGPIWVELAWGDQWQPDQLRLEVANLVNDGPGLTQPIRPVDGGALWAEASEHPTPGSGAAHPGLGLISMRQRLESVGGRMDVRRRGSPDGDVFTVTCWLPVRSAELR